MFCQLTGRLLFNTVVSDSLITVLPGQSENAVKVKVTQRSDHEGPEVEKMYSCTLPSTSEQDGGGCSKSLLAMWICLKFQSCSCGKDMLQHTVWEISEGG